MRILVAGGAGFLGANLCQRLIDDGHTVVAIDDFSTGTNRRERKAGERYMMFTGDITTSDLAHVGRWLGRADWVLNLASPASPVAYGEMPIHTMLTGSYGTKRLLDFAVVNDAKFLQASTSEVYGDPLVHPQPEGYWGNVNPVGWRSCYDEAKRFSEALVTAYRTERGVETRIPRIFNTYGPGMALDDGRPVVTFVKQALMGQPITVQGDGSQTRSFCYVDDMIEAIVRLMMSDWQLPINLGNTEEITILDLALVVKEVVGSDSPIEFVQRVDDDPQQRRPDTRLAKSVLGWEPSVPLAFGIKRVADYVVDKIEETVDA